MQFNLFDWLKLFATPLTVAFSSVWINRTIQRQNALAQRQSSYLLKQADEFLKIASAINDEATGFVIAFWWEAKKQGDKASDIANEEIDIGILRRWRELQRCQWEMWKYIDLAPIAGKRLGESMQQLIDEVLQWSSHNGGQVEIFRNKQLAFNLNVREVHAEILALGQ